MKKSYIILIILAVLGVEAIVLYPSKKQDTVNTTADLTTNTTDSATATSTALKPVPTSQSTTQSSSRSTTSSLKDGTFTGTRESNPFGDVKVSIVVSAGKITDVTFISLPDADRRSVQINDQASPILKTQTIKAQSTNIDGVSGATYTSESYINSLQAAIDAAKGA